MKFAFLIALSALTFQLIGEETHLLYIRHGEVPSNLPSSYIYNGWNTDEFLTEKGEGQARQCAEVLSDLQQKGIIDKVTAIYASDLKRAVQTAKPISEKLGLEVHQRFNLREINWGAADGQLVKDMHEKWDSTEQQVYQQYPDRKIRWNYLPVYPNAETYNALLQRVTSELSRIGVEHAGETVVVIGHGRSLKTLIADQIDDDTEGSLPHIGNCKIVEFTYSPEKGLQLVRIFD